MIQSAGRAVAQGMSFDITFIRAFAKNARLQLTLAEEMALPVVAIVGRPNVGKSALYNRFVRKKDALVYDTPHDHVTRDYKEGIGQLADLVFKAVDTSGLEPFMSVKTIQGRASAITARVLERAHITLFVMDAKAGVLPGDFDLAQWLRRTIPPTHHLLVVANKAENQRAREGMSETVADAWKMGLGEPVALSATTGEGMTDLYTQLQPLVDTITQRLTQQLEDQRRQRIENKQRRLLYASSNTLISEAAATSTTTTTSTSRSAEPGAEIADTEPSRLTTECGSSSKLVELDLSLVETQLSSNSSSSSNMSDGIGVEEVGRHTNHDTLELMGGRGGADSAAVSAVVQQGLVVGSAAVDTVEPEEGEEEEGGLQGTEAPVRIAIMGLPNVGKSTLMNQLLQDERCVTGPEPGLTRDAVRVMWEYGGQVVELVDTAGWTRASKLEQFDAVGGEVAAMTLDQGMKSMQRVQVVVMVLDAQRCLGLDKVMTRKELALAGDALEEGKAMVLVLNKMDTLPRTQQEALTERVVEVIEESFTDAGRLPCVSMSALTGSGVDELMPSILQAYGRWNQRVSTSRLNQFIRRLAVARSGTGLTGTEVARIKYLTQVKARPPTFAAFTRGSEPISEPTARFLAGEIRETLGFEGVPLRVLFRYNDKASTRNPGSGFKKAGKVPRRTDAFKGKPTIHKSSAGNPGKDRHDFSKGRDTARFSKSKDTTCFSRGKGKAGGWRGKDTADSLRKGSSGKSRLKAGKADGGRSPRSSRPSSAKAGGSKRASKQAASMR